MISNISFNIRTNSRYWNISTNNCPIWNITITLIIPIKSNYSTMRTIINNIIYILIFIGQFISSTSITIFINKMNKKVIYFSRNKSIVLFTFIKIITRFNSRMSNSHFTIINIKYSITK